MPPKYVETLVESVKKWKPSDEAINSWDAVIECAHQVNILAIEQYQQLLKLDWKINFAKFVSPRDERVWNPEEMWKVPAGAFLAFIEVDRPSRSNGTKGRRHLIHAMLTLGNGWAAGLNNFQGIGIGNVYKWELLNLAKDLNWISQGMINGVPLGGNGKRLMRLRYRSLVDLISSSVEAGRDLKKLENIKAELAGQQSVPFLNTILEEVLWASQNCFRWPDGWMMMESKGEMGRGGHSQVYYDTFNPNGPRHYQIAYLAGNLGTLLHELTHVVVNEAYQHDFINFDGDVPGNLPKRRLGNDGGVKNEEARQAAWITAHSDKIEMLIKEIEHLLKLFRDSSVHNDPTIGKVVQEKLENARLKPHIEHDTELNQILFLVHVEWKQVIAANAHDAALQLFLNQLEQSCREAYRHRAQARSRNARRAITV